MDKELKFKERIITSIKGEDEPCLIFCTGFAGQKLLKACHYYGISVIGFCDEDKKKEGTTLAGLPVYHTDRIVKEFSENPILVSYWNIAISVQKLTQYGASKIYPALLLLGDDELKQDSEDYIFDSKKYYATVGKTMHLHYLKPKAVVLENLGFTATSKCSLKCKYCASFIPYRNNPSDVAVEENIECLKKMLTLCDHICYVNIIGGEVFCSKTWQDLVREIKKHLGNEIGMINITTNGTIVPKKEDLKLLADDRIFVAISDYGDVSYGKEKMITAFRKYGVWHSLNKMTWYKVSFPKRHYRSREENAKVFAECRNNSCFSVFNGRLSRCGMSAGVEHDLFSTEVFLEDSFDVFGQIDRNVPIEDIKQGLNEFLRNPKPLKACDYCEESSRNVEEVVSGEQLVSTDEALSDLM